VSSSEDVDFVSALVSSVTQSAELTSARGSGVSNSCSLSPHGETPQDELGRTGERQVDTVQATSVCNKLWTELQSAMGARER
jgi:hypothetical protein